MEKILENLVTEPEESAHSSLEEQTVSNFKTLTYQRQRLPHFFKRRQSSLQLWQAWKASSRVRKASEVQLIAKVKLFNLTYSG